MSYMKEELMRVAEMIKSEIYGLELPEIVALHNTFVSKECDGDGFIHRFDELKEMIRNLSPMEIVARTAHGRFNDDCDYFVVYGDWDIKYIAINDDNIFDYVEVADIAMDLTANPNDYVLPDGIKSIIDSERRKEI